MRIIFLTFAIISATSCNVKESSKAVNETQALKKGTLNNMMSLYPELKERIGKTELTPLRNYYRLILASDSTCRIEWGNAKVNNSTKSDYHFHTARRFRINWENDDFLVLKAGTGSDTWFSLFLPLDSLAEESIIHNTLARNEERSLVVAEQSSGTDTIMFIYNLKSGQTQYIVDKEKCEAFHHYCLDTVIVKEKEMYYRWVVPHKYMDNPRTIERKLKIRI